MGCEEPTSATGASRFRRLLAKYPAKPGLLCDLNGNFAKDRQESLQLLMKTYFPGCLNTDDTRDESTVSTSREMGRDMDIVNEEKISWAIGSYHTYKSAGPDA